MAGKLQVYRRNLPLGKLRQLLISTAVLLSPQLHLQDGRQPRQKEMPPDGCLPGLPLADFNQIMRMGFAKVNTCRGSWGVQVRRFPAMSRQTLECQIILAFTKDHQALWQLPGWNCVQE